MQSKTVADENLNLPSDPVEGFLLWLADAEKAGLPEPTAMTLATATREGRPSARVVLFKGMGLSSDGVMGLRFFTNYKSPKSKDLELNPFAALTFFWPGLHRQLRIEGSIEKISNAESDIYFQSRPRGSRIGAWASPQSQKIKSRAELLKLVADAEIKFTDHEITCPDYWGGWLLKPERVEFWQAGEFRLHDRFEYVRSGQSWQCGRLAP